MARKDRVPDPPKRSQGPQRRSTPTDPAAAAARKRRFLAVLAAAGLVALALALTAVLTRGGDDSDGRATLTAADCTLEIRPGLPGEHTLQVGATSKKWNSDPPTSGPHNELPAVWGSYEDPVPLAQSVHNLEHGGIVIHYGDAVPAAELEAIRNFYDEDPNGLIVARLPKNGNKITLSAWTTEDGSPTVVGSDNGNGYLATCTKFDDKAFSSFVKDHRYKGPERFPPESLIPGS